MEQVERAVKKAGDLAEGAACPTTKVRCAWNAGIALFVVVVLVLVLIGSIVNKKTPTTTVVVLGCLVPLVLLFLAWNVFRYRMVDKLCHYEFPKGTPCPDYQAKWRQAFRNSKIVTAANNVQAAASGLKGSSNGVVSGVASATDTAAGVGGTVAGVQRTFQDWEMNHRLYKCATGGTMAKGPFVAMRISMVGVPVLAALAVSWRAFHARLTEALRRSQAQDKERGDTTDKGNPATAATVVCLLVAAIVGGTIGNVLLIVQSGRWRRKIGLTFIDWPRLVL